MVHSESHKKALKEGLLTQKQYDKLPEALLDGIIKSKRAKGTKAPIKQARASGSTRKAKPSGKPKGTHKMPNGELMTGKVHNKNSKPVKSKGKKGKKK